MSMFYAVRQVHGEVLTKMLTWIPVSKVKENINLVETLLPIRRDKGDNVTYWFAAQKNPICLFGAKTMNKTYGFNVPEEATFYLEDGITKKIYPEVLNRKPKTDYERDFFQTLISDGLDGIQERVLLCMAGASAKVATELFGDLDYALIEEYKMKLDEIINQKQNADEPKESKEDIAEGEIGEEEEGMGDAKDSGSLGGFIIRRQPTVNEFINKASLSIDSLLEVLDDLAALEMEKQGELTQIDSKQMDLLHLIEFTDLNAADRARVFVSLQTVRRERRDIKNTLLAIYNLKQVLHSIDLGVMRNAAKGIHNISNQIYCTRVLTEDDVHTYIPNETAFKKLCNQETGEWEE